MTKRTCAQSVRKAGLIMGAVLLGLSLFRAAAGAAEVTPDLVLAAAGHPRCVIVAAGGLSPSEQTAVKELQKYLQLISGGDAVKVVAPDQANAATNHSRIVVGNQTVSALYPDVSLKDLGTDGFLLKTVGNSLLVAGGEKRGTLYAAFELLEKLGVRWWAVGATQVPHKPDLTVSPLDERQIPKLEYRDMLYGMPELSDEDNKTWFFAHNKINGFFYAECPEALGGRVEFNALGHNFTALMQPVGDLDGTFKAHPEYWAWHKGKRSPAQVCTLDTNVFEIMKANVFKEFRKHPEMEFVPVGQEDNLIYCKCEKCAALSEREGSQAAPGLVLVNKIAEAVENEFPGKSVVAMAYQWSRKPPKSIKPRRNVIVLLASIECDFNRPMADLTTPDNRAFAEDIIAWGKIAPKFYVWDYTTDFSHYFMPFPDLDALVPNIQFLARHGAAGILEQGSHGKMIGGEFDTLREWVIAKALWNPEHADGPALIREFLDGYYGPAGAAIQKYINILHAPGRANPGMITGCFSLLDAAWLTPEVMAESERALQEAERAVADNPVLLARVRHAHLPVWYVLLKRGTQSQTWAATVAQVGKLDIANIAEQIAKVIADRQTVMVAERETIQPFLDWTKDYAAQAAKSPPLPPELSGVDPKSYRLIQACQMDQRPQWWVRQAGASDDWVSEIPSTGWTVYHQFSCVEDIVPGKTYKIFVRVKTSAPKPDGNAFACGLYEKDSKSNFDKKVPATELADGQFHAFEIGEFVAAPNSGRFWIALDKSSNPKVFLDCLWLKEVSQ